MWTVELGTPASMMVSLQTGRNDVSVAKLKLISPSGVQFHCKEASIDEGKWLHAHFEFGVPCS